MRREIFNTVLHGQRLFQQFAVDTYIKLETTRLNYILFNQSRIRADLYQGLMDSVYAGEHRASALGKLWVLPASFIGGPRDMRRRYMDAFALVQKYGKPDIFLTMTCNPNWEEITSELEPGQKSQDRCDLVVRVFKAKLDNLKHQLFKKHILGVMAAHVYVIEFQKRGLPHAHFLLIMQTGSKLIVPDQYDAVISAELPDKNRFPELFDMVVKHMMHGPCGHLNMQNTCMKNGSCKCHYPRLFGETTLQGKDSYPIYRRRDDGQKVRVRGHDLDNRWVVPYNPTLLRMYDCHINVEVCSSIKAVKYIYKYIHKGHDRASVTVIDVDGGQSINEIENFRDARWVSPQEALWRIYSFDLHGISPPVLQLQLHLPGMHLVSYNINDDMRQVLNKDNIDKSMLTEYFRANQLFDWASNYLYREFPEVARWWPGAKKWTARQQRMQVGRIVSAHPAEGERYYLRVLLNHVRGATSFESLRTYDGNVYPTFREATEKRGLIEADNNIDECLTEASGFHMPPSLRRLFATILVFCEPTDVVGLWNKHLEAMSDDFCRTHSNSNVVEQLVLLDIRDMLQTMGKDIRLFPLPAIKDEHDNMADVVREIFEEMNIPEDPEAEFVVSSLNHEQRHAYDVILSSVENISGGVFFVDGPGGTGKTFLYKALLATVRRSGKIATATATSGVAASIMPGGRTAHSRLWNSRLNTKKGHQETNHLADEDGGSSCDVEIIKTPCELPISLNASSQVQPFISSCALPATLTSTNTQELMSALCTYIMEIDDAEYLEKHWIQSTKPYPISLSLQQLKNILDVNKPMDKDCFNIAVRMIACSDALFLLENKYHYMDLQFCSITNYGQDPRLRAKLDTNVLANLFECWPDMEYTISDCSQILLPFCFLGHFSLYVFNMNTRSIYIMDSMPLPSWFKDFKCTEDQILGRVDEVPGQ
ncbi:DNA helicase-like protein [Zea mays]|uniref:ATP-dependent DNA helicase n=1 Tax=Zea mays TaxID=4577 RepID=A0A1D6KND6_MAIZE|nr:DNA helicase-like protein [Zea mays]